MTVNNRLDLSFGPVGTTSGMILFMAGLILIWFYPSSALLIVLGAFIGFTSTSTTIDYDKKRARFSNNLFGIIPIGKWITVDPSMKIGIKELHQTYRAYSQGNRPFTIARYDFRIILYDSEKKEMMPLKRTKSIDAAKAECETIATFFGLEIV